MVQALNLRKIHRRAEELERMRFVGMKSLFPMDAVEDGRAADIVRAGLPDDISGKRMNEGDHFIGRDPYLWLRVSTDIPSATAELRPAALFDFSGGGADGNSGFEALLYVNGQPCQGLDPNHKEVMLDAWGGQEAELALLLWSGLEGGVPKTDQDCRMGKAQAGSLHTSCDQLYYYCRTIAQTLDILPEASPHRAPLFAAIEEALLKLDWDADRFYETVAPALQTMEKRLAAMEKTNPVTVCCVGHTHIDLAWLWRVKHAREKAQRSFATALHLMEEFEECYFTQSQPQIYRYLEADNSELFEKIRAKVAEGRWEPEGGMWVEADCNISSGEALVRQFLHGIRYFEKTFGKRPVCLWLPDVFGYSWALPQIMNQCGITSFMTTKISWNQFNTMPNDLFLWRGIDGSEVAAYFITTPEPDAPEEKRFSTYNGQLTPSAVNGSWKRFRNKDLSNEVMIAYGFGDGGGGPTRDMLRARQIMDKLPGLPWVKTGSAAGFFTRLSQRLAQNKNAIPVWDGELYLEYHRGTYTSQAKTKQWNRRLENELFETELWSAAAFHGGGYPKSALEESWEIVLRNQFHDIVPGSSIGEVYEDSRQEYERAAALLEEARESAFQALIAPAQGRYTLFNGSSFARNDAQFIPVAEDGCFSINGANLPAQRANGGYWVQLPLPPLSASVIHFAPGSPQVEAESPFAADIPSRFAETPFYSLRWDETGQLVSLYDKEAAREILAQAGNRLEIYEDKPVDYDNWDIDIFHIKKCEQVVMDREPEIVESGFLRLVLRFHYTWRRSSFVQDMVLFRNNRRIDFQTRALWHEDHRLLKVAFETGLRSTKASYDIQFGFTERPTHDNTSWDIARFEVVGHRWADLSESNYGVSLLNDCKYGYSIRGGSMRMSLLKSGKYPDAEADMGEHSFTYALLPHPTSLAGSDTQAQAAALNQPVHVRGGAPLKGAAGAPITLSGGVAVVDAVKRAEDGNDIVVRLHECGGGSQRIFMRTSLPIESIRPCDALELPVGNAFSPDAWACELSPFEMKSFRLALKDGQS
jgi:alpha-mannosidase